MYVRNYVRTAVGECIAVAVLTNDWSKMFTQQTIFAFTEHCHSLHTFKQVSLFVELNSTQYSL